VFLEMRAGKETGDWTPSINGYVQSFCASSDRYLIAEDDSWKTQMEQPTSRKSRLVAWDVATGQEHRFPKDISVFGMSFVDVSKDGRLLLGRTDEGLALWQMATGEQLWQPPLKLQQILSYRLSPDGRMVAWYDSKERKICLCEIASSQIVKTFQGHLGRVLRMTFSPNGRTLVSGSDDSTVLFWDVIASTDKVTKPLVLEDDWNQAFLELRGDDAVLAWQAVGRLADSPQQAVLRIERQWKLWWTEAEQKERAIGGLIAKLDSADFSERESAQRSLAQMGSVVIGALRQAREHSPSAESKRRLNQLLANEPLANATRLQLLASRLCQVMELCATPEATSLIQEWTTASQPALAEEAKSTLRRLRGDK